MSMCQRVPAMIEEEEEEDVRVVPAPLVIVGRGTNWIQEEEEDRVDAMALLSDDDRTILAFLTKSGVADLYGPDLERRSGEVSSSSSKKEPIPSCSAKKEEVVTISSSTKMDRPVEKAPVLSDKKINNLAASSSAARKRKATEDQEPPVVDKNKRPKISSVGASVGPDTMVQIGRKKVNLKEEGAKFMRRRFAEERYHLRRETGAKVVGTFEEWREVRRQKLPGYQVKALCKSAATALGRKYQVGSNEHSKKHALLWKICNEAVKKESDAFYEKARRVFRQRVRLC